MRAAAEEKRGSLFQKEIIFVFCVFRVFRDSYLLQQLFGEAGWVTFRTETQRGTECTEGKCVKYLDLIYILVPFHIARLWPD